MHKRDETIKHGLVAGLFWKAQCGNCHRALLAKATVELRGFFPGDSRRNGFVGVVEGGEARENVREGWCFEMKMEAVSDEGDLILVVELITQDGLIRDV